MEYKLRENLSQLTQKLVAWRKIQYKRTQVPVQVGTDLQDQLIAEKVRQSLTRASSVIALALQKGGQFLGIQFRPDISYKTPKIIIVARAGTSPPTLSRSLLALKQGMHIAERVARRPEPEAGVARRG